MGKIAAVTIVSLWVIPISILVNRIVPEPYMDEIFHVPQAQQYCKGNFKSWDPMITTPPGLYLLSLVYAAPFYPATFIDLCSTAMLRSINGVLAIICSVLIYEILIRLKPDLGDKKATLYAVVLSVYPLHWFFSFLYYTDVASLAVVLSMYLACLKKNYWLSALFGAFAVIIRQTNIIWMLFVACTGVINITLPAQRVSVTDSNKLVRGKAKLDYKDTFIFSQSLRRRKDSNGIDTVVDSINTRSAPLNQTTGLIDEIKSLLLTSWFKKWELLVLFSPFFMVLVAFLAFVKCNGSIVLGAKDAHTVSPHFAQLMYYSLVSTLAMAPVHFSLDQAGGVFHSLWKRRPFSFVQLFVALLAGFLSVHFFSIAHPYLLADNRHYPFYLWRRVIMSHWLIKYLLVPLYTYSWFSIFTLLAKTQRRVWILVYFLATAATLVPAPLIEFRYYTIPFYLMMLHSELSDHRKWLLMGVLYAAVDVFTVVIFLFHPFEWDHEPGIQRFIW